MSTSIHFAPSHSSRPRRAIETLMEQCDVELNGNRPWDTRVHKVLMAPLS